MDAYYLSKDFFDCECKRIKAMIISIIGQSEKIIESAANRVVRKEYASGGECLPRGYYCPNIIVDIVVGGVNRGHLLKRVTSVSKKDFSYGFDEDDKLILAESKSSIETLLFENGDEFGISFEKSTNSIELISECKFVDGKIKTYSTFQYLQHLDMVTQCERQDYYYEGDKMIVDWYRCVNGIANKYICYTEPRISYFRYVFPLVDKMLKKGTNYTVYEYCSDGLKTQTTIGNRTFSVPNGREYEVRINRNV